MIATMKHHPHPIQRTEPYMATFSVRNATFADLGVLRRFEQAIVDAERSFDPTLRSGEVQYYDIERLLTHPDARMVFAQAANDVIGCGLARIDASKPYLRHAQHGYLGLMYTDEAFRGRGVNRMIVAALTDWCLSRGVMELRLDVYSDNQPAIRAYERSGFSKHLVEMRMPLPK